MTHTHGRTPPSQFHLDQKHNQTENPTTLSERPTPRQQIMKITLSHIAATVAPASAFILPDTVPRRILLLPALHSAADDDASSSSSYSRRSFVNHVVTATTAGTLSTLSIGSEPAVAAASSSSSTNLAGQIDLPPMGLGAWGKFTNNVIVAFCKYSCLHVKSLGRLNCVGVRQEKRQ